MINFEILCVLIRNNMEILADFTLIITASTIAISNIDSHKIVLSVPPHTLVV